MGARTWSALTRVRAAMKKVANLLNLNRIRWRLASHLRQRSLQRPRRLSFNDRPGLIGCVDDDSETEESGLGSRLLRASSCISDQDDVDKRADAFIANFYRQLRLERQVSLELRYRRGKSF
ncbi:hypothetical protein AAG906_002623 [Vitis piasezkii]|uniref:DUF761 domain-containing protein n=1 Tax=Vitis vinifera TaxID=29760 RepID=A0A438K8I4_VITVI|nr:uncharacterized protein LOC117913592 [Vitis riparia]RVW52314.1 hypothetical protein CK203_093380 [Vitis vinifera]RVX17507.1 hypothetical protein CK203_003699 [Vitis vinifera]